MNTIVFVSPQQLTTTSSCKKCMDYRAEGTFRLDTNHIPRPRWVANCHIPFRWLFEALDEAWAGGYGHSKIFWAMTTYRTVFKKLSDRCTPPGSGLPRCESRLGTSKMPKITISGIAVLGFLELRDRVWEGTRLFSHAFGTNQAQRAGSSLTNSRWWKSNSEILEFIFLHYFF